MVDKEDIKIVIEKAFHAGACYQDRVYEEGLHAEDYQSSLGRIIKEILNNENK